MSQPPSKGITMMNSAGSLPTATTTTTTTTASTQDWFMMTGDLIINLRSTKTGDSRSQLKQQPKLSKRETFVKKKAEINEEEVEEHNSNEHHRESNHEMISKNQTLTSTGHSNSSSGNSSGLVDEEEGGGDESQSQNTSPANDDDNNNNNKQLNPDQRNLSDDSSFYYEHYDDKQEHCYENIGDGNLSKCSHESNLYNELTKTSCPSSEGDVDEELYDDDDDDDSDNASLGSFKYTSVTRPNCSTIDPPSASRLAKRLYYLDGFQKSDVARHLGKNNQFSRLVAEEYAKLFDFAGQRLDCALRTFLARFHLLGETQEQERILVFFAKRYKACNPHADELRSEDATHTLTCALMLLNTDLQEKNIQRKMTCSDFIMNLAKMNDGEDYPVALLKDLYYCIKTEPLSHAQQDSEQHHHHQSPRTVFSKITTITKSIGSPSSVTGGGGGSLAGGSPGLTLHRNSFVDLPNPNFAIEYKKGYIRRKCCYDCNGRKPSLWNRGWKMFYATLRDLVLYLHKDESGFRKWSHSNECYANSIRIHHSMALPAKDYAKKRFVFRLITADCAEYLFETSDSKELQSWVDTINTTAASLSAPALPMAVSSDNCKLGRDLYPVSHTKLSLVDQLNDHESKLLSLQKELETLLDKSLKGSTNSRFQKAFMETENYLQHEIQRYRTYIACVKRKLQDQFMVTTTNHNTTCAANSTITSDELNVYASCSPNRSTSTTTASSASSNDSASRHEPSPTSKT